jgi:hypothetical protein
VLAGPAWSATFKTYTFPGASPALTVDIQTEFTATQVETIRNTLSHFPVDHLKPVKYIELRSSADRNSFEVDPLGGGIILFSIDNTVLRL